VLDDNTTSAATSNFDDLIPSVEDIANYLSAAKLLDNRGAVARDHLGKYQVSVSLEIFLVMHQL
jgi:hypothetical protein